MAELLQKVSCKCLDPRILDVKREIAMKIKETVLASATDFDCIECKLKVRKYKTTKNGNVFKYIIYYVKIPEFLINHLRFRKGDLLEVAFRKIGSNEKKRVEN
jgi:hypothetical protein